VLNAGGEADRHQARQKLYRHRCSGRYPPRLAKEVLADDPERAIREAVWGMMPKGPLGRRIIKKLKIYRGKEHEHVAQKPRELEIKN
jgi:large subunit ribosomal protein L13